MWPIYLLKLPHMFVWFICNPENRCAKCCNHWYLSVTDWFRFITIRKSFSSQKLYCQNKPLKIWKEYDNHQKLQKKTGTIQSICDSKSHFSFLAESCFVLGSDIYNDNPVFLQNLFYSSDYNLFPLQKVSFSPPPSISENKGFQLENFWIIVNHIRESKLARIPCINTRNNLPILKNMVPESVFHID